MIVLIFFMIIIITVIVLFTIYFTNKEYYPSWRSSFEPEPTNMEQDLYFQVLLPIRNINEESLTPETIKESLLDCDYNGVLSYLNTLGQVTWESPSGTMVILKIKAGNIPAKLENYGGSIFTLNNPFYFYYQDKKLILVGLNRSIDENINLQTPFEWSRQFNLINQPFGTNPAKTPDILTQASIITNVIKNEGGSIGIYWNGNLPSLVLLENLAIRMGYPSDKFVNQLTQIQSNPFSGYVILENQFSEENLNDEINLDLQAVFSVSPDINCIIYQRLNSNNLNLSILWESTRENSFPSIWSSSNSISEKFTPQDTIRIHQEYKLLALCGINTFQASGDNGNYSSMITPDVLENATADIMKPDVAQGQFDSPYTIKVGAYSQTISDDDDSPYNKRISMVLPYNISNQDIIPNPYIITLMASGGGFSRGQRDDPLWKNINTHRYRKLYGDISIQTLSNTIEKINVDIKGNACPDIIGPGNASIPNPTEGQTSLFGWVGTSYASPYMASVFASLAYRRNSRFIMLCKELHQNPDLMDRVIEGRNSIYNVNGYLSTSFDLETKWDPVQGLGIPNASKLLAHFNPPQSV